MEARGSVHEVESAGEPRRRDRDQLDRKRGARDDHHGVAYLRVAVAVADEHPDEEGDHRREVHRRVEQVQGLGEERRLEDEVLHRHLAEQVQPVLEAEDPTTASDRTVHLEQ